MPRLGDFIQPPPDPEDEPQEQQMFEGRIANTPSGPDDDLFVIIPSFDEGKHKFGPVQWRPVEVGGKELLPKEDAVCLVAKPSQTSHVWLIAWS